VLLDRFLLTLSRVEKESGLAILLGSRVAKTIAEALKSTGRFEKRRRILSATLMTYFVIGAVYYRSLSMPNVFRSLFLGLTLPGDGRRAPAESALVDARYRLGFEPVKRIFESLAAEVVVPRTFHGYRSHVIDGVRFKLADTPMNEKRFGRPKSGRGRASHPVTRVVVMATTYSHEVEAIDIDRWDAPENDAVWKLIEKLGKEDLVLLDRLFPSGPLFQGFQERGVAVVARISATWKPKIVRRLGTGDFIVDIKGKEPIEAGKPTAKAVRGKGRPRKFRSFTVRLRMIVYKCGGSEILRLLTTLPTHIPAIDIAQLYHERWEIELVNAEVKNYLAARLHGSEKLCFRSDKPDGVLQDIYATFTAHLMLRQTMRAAAEAHGLKPLQVSFTDSLNTVRRFLPVLQFASADLRPRLIEEVYRQIAEDCRLRPRRNRQYARKVKVKMSDFKCKKVGDVQTKVDHAARTRLVNPARRLARAA
jgi:hypothetical protein